MSVSCCCFCSALALRVSSIAALSSLGLSLPGYTQGQTHTTLQPRTRPDTAVGGTETHAACAHYLYVRPGSGRGAGRDRLMYCVCVRECVCVPAV
jgi:hypothetical protein